MYFTAISFFLFFISLIRYILVTYFPTKISKQKRDNINNIEALNYGIIIATSITGIIMVNYYKCCVDKQYPSVKRLRIHDFIFHILPLLFINYISPESNDVTINRKYIYASFFIFAVPYTHLINVSKLYHKAPLNFCYFSPVIISVLISLSKYPPNKK